MEGKLIACDVTSVDHRSHFEDGLNVPCAVQYSNHIKSIVMFAIKDEMLFKTMNRPHTKSTKGRADILTTRASAWRFSKKCEGRLYCGNKAFRNINTIHRKMIRQLVEIFSRLRSRYDRKHYGLSRVLASWRSRTSRRTTCQSSGVISRALDSNPASNIDSSFSCALSFRSSLNNARKYSLTDP